MNKQNTRVVTDVQFMDGGAGPLFSIFSKPEMWEYLDNRCTVLLVPPFAEEMNRSRRFLTLLRMRLAKMGCRVILTDFYGTGDSAGDFEDATWDIWLEDLIRTAKTYNFRLDNGCILIGVRSGCLLIDELAKSAEFDEQFGSLLRTVYVQPETSGLDLLIRLLRTRVAAKKFSGNSTESTDLLWKKFVSGENVRVSGYEIGSSLAMSLRDKFIDNNNTDSKFDRIWIELMANTQSSTLYRGWKVAERPARPFWQLHDNEPDADLITYVASCAYQMENGRITS